MKIRFMTIPAALTLGAFLSAGAWAQTGQKVASISMQDALVATKDGQKAIADLRAKFLPKDQELQKRTQDLQAKQDQYRKTQSTISAEAKAALERDIDSMTRSLQRDQDDAKQDMDQDQQRMIQELGAKIMQVVTKYAADNQYALVFDTSGQPNNILFASSAVDITRDIVALYDKNAPAGPATTTAAPASRPAAVPHTAANAPAQTPAVRKPPAASPAPAK